MINMRIRGSRLYRIKKCLLIRLFHASNKTMFLCWVSFVIANAQSHPTGPFLVLQTLKPLCTPLFKTGWKSFWLQNQLRADKNYYAIVGMSTGSPKVVITFYPLLWSLTGVSVF